MSARCDRWKQGPRENPSADDLRGRAAALSVAGHHTPEGQPGIVGLGPPARRLVRAHIAVQLSAGLSTAPRPAWPWAAGPVQTGEIGASTALRRGQGGSPPPGSRAQRHGYRLEQCSRYSDSITALPLARPRSVNAARSGQRGPCACEPRRQRPGSGRCSLRRPESRCASSRLAGPLSCWPSRRPLCDGLRGPRRVGPRRVLGAKVQVVRARRAYSASGSAIPLTQLH